MKILRYLLVASTLCVSTYVNATISHHCIDSMPLYAAKAIVQGQSDHAYYYGNNGTVFACISPKPFSSVGSSSWNFMKERVNSDICKLTRKNSEALNTELGRFNPAKSPYKEIGRPLYLNVSKGLLCLKKTPFSWQGTEQNNYMFFCLFSSDNYTLRNSEDAADISSSVSSSFSTLESTTCPSGYELCSPDSGPCSE